MKRGRNHQRRRQGPNINRALDSNGPDVRIRGTANQIYDKYLALARDANSSGDRVKAENYLQHAEHYFRIIKAMQPQHASQPDSAGGDDDQVFDDDREHDRFSDSRREQNGENAVPADQPDEVRDDQPPAPEARGAPGADEQRSPQAPSGERQNGPFQQGDGDREGRRRRRRPRRHPREGGEGQSGGPAEESGDSETADVAAE